MKKSGIFIIPILIFAIITFLGNRLFASGAVSPTTLVLMAGAAFFVLMMIRPKAATRAATPDSALTLLGDFAKDAFAEDAKLSSKYQSALADYLNNMPKAAINKLEKLQSQCKTDADNYAVNVALGLAKTTVGDFEAAIKLYNKAVVLFPNTELAAAIGACQQRIGELKAARDSYEFALELDHNNIDARSSLATAYVADGKFYEAIDEARLTLEMDENHATALATCAICYGVLDNSLLYKSYTEKAVSNGYKEDKITSTVPALKKKYRKTLESMN